MRDVNLPKWPFMVVMGDPVTPKQAAEILIRTSRLPYLSTNEEKFHSGIRSLFGLCSAETVNEMGYLYAEESDMRRKLGILELGYLGNEQIASCWYGGAHGWCSWDGRIDARSYNIGKWPHAQEVLRDWKLIAKTFPFLRLSCWLYAHERSEDGLDLKSPLVEFRVKDGKARMARKPSVPADTWVELPQLNLFQVGREQGIDLGSFQQKLIDVYGENYPQAGSA